MLRVEKKNRTGTVTVYGEVGGEDFCSWKISEIIADLNNWVDCKVINLHLHTYGGQVIDGSVTWNIINKSVIPVDIYIDGIAASMGAILLTAARHVYIADNGLVMIHRPSGWIHGTADRLETEVALLRSMEENAIRALCGKTRKSESEIREMFTSDKDYWFTARQAKKLGIVDEIIPAVTNSVKELDAIVEAKPDQKKMYARFEASLNNLKMNDMELKQQLSSLLGLQATDDDSRFVSAVSSIVNDTDHVSRIVNRAVASGFVDQDASGELIEMGKFNASGLSSYLKKLEEKKQEEMRGKTERLIQAHRACFFSLSEDAKTRMRELMCSPGNFEAIKELMEKMPKQQTFTSMIQGARSVEDKGREAWTLDDYREKDPEYLRKNPGFYKQLLDKSEAGH